VDLPGGIYNRTYAQDMAILRTKTHWALFIALLAFIFTAPLYWGQYALHVANLMGITVIAALGLNILLGYCGQISIGHAAFIGVGAYTAAFLTARLELPFLVGLIAAGLIAGFVGLIFGIPSLRVKGFYLLMATLAAQFILSWVFLRWVPVTGGPSGITATYASIGGFVFKSEASYFYLIMVIAVICTFFAKNLARTRVGRAFIAIRDNDLAAEVMGINLFSYKLLAFFIGCFFAGIAGSLYAHWIGHITPPQFSLMGSILYIGMVIIGGIGTTLGAILGVIFMRLLEQGLLMLAPLLSAAFPLMETAFASALCPLVFGIVIIVFLIAEPRGLAHRWMLLKSAYRLWPFSY